MEVILQKIQRLTCMMIMSSVFWIHARRKGSIISQLLEEENMVENILCEPHNLSGLLKEDRENFMATMNNLADINALVERCCWKASG